MNHKLYAVYAGMAFVFFYACMAFAARPDTEPTMFLFPVASATPSHFPRFARENDLDVNPVIPGKSTITTDMTMHCKPTLADCIAKELSIAFLLSAKGQVLPHRRLLRISESPTQGAAPEKEDAVPELPDDASVLMALQHILFLDPLPVPEMEKAIVRLLGSIPEQRRGIWLETLPALISRAKDNIATAAYDFGKILGVHSTELSGTPLHAFLLNMRATTLLSINEPNDALHYCRQLLEQYAKDDSPAVIQQRAAALFGTGIIHALSNDRSNAKAAFMEVIDSFADKESEDAFICFQVARSRFYLASLLGDRGEGDKALQYLDDCISEASVWESIPALKDVALQAMVEKGMLLLRLGKFAESDSVLADIVASYATGSVDEALYAIKAQQGRLFATHILGKQEEAWHLTQEFVAVFGKRTEPEILVPIVRALLAFAVRFQRQSDSSDTAEALHMAESIAERLPQGETAADLLLSIGRISFQNGQLERAKSSAERILATYRDNADDLSRDTLVQVYELIRNAKYASGDNVGAAEACRELIREFDDDQDDLIEDKVFFSWYTLIELLFVEGRTDDVMAACEEMVSRFDGVSHARRHPEIVQLKTLLENPDETKITAWLFRLAIGQATTLPVEQQPIRLDGLLARFEGREEPEIVTLVNHALFTKGRALFNAGREEEGEDILTGLVEQNGADATTENQMVAVNALSFFAQKKAEAGQRDAAAELYRRIVEQYGDAPETVGLTIAVKQALKKLDALKQQTE